MAPPNHLYLVLPFFLSIFTLSFSPTSARILPKVHLPLPPASSKLVGNFCNSGSVGSHRFCLKALSGVEAATAKDSTQLGVLIMKLGAANGNITLNVYNEMVKKPSSPEAALKALNSCVVAYKYAIQSFEMVSSELVEDPQTANYDVSLVAPEITNCENELTAAKVVTPRLHFGNRFLQYYTAMGIQITSILQLEKPNDY